MSEKRPADKAYVLGRMQNICSKAEKCTLDIQQKLRNYNLGEEDGQWIIQKLKEDKFIDESRFAGFYVKDKFRFNKWGRIKISHSLRMKGIEENIISGAIEEQINEDDYLEVLKELLISKNKSLKEKDSYLRKGKLVRFATQRGFEPELVFVRLEGIVK